MASLVLLDYDDAGIKQPSRSAVAAASQLGEVHVLVAGEKDDLDPQAAQRDVLAAARDLLARHPAVAAIVLECTNLPPYAAVLQATFGLPVYDIHSMITWLQAGLRPRTFAGRLPPVQQFEPGPGGRR